MACETVTRTLSFAHPPGSPQPPDQTTTFLFCPTGSDITPESSPITSSFVGAHPPSPTTSSAPSPNVPPVTDIHPPTPHVTTPPPFATGPPSQSDRVQTGTFRTTFVPPANSTSLSSSLFSSSSSATLLITNAAPFPSQGEIPSGNHESTVSSPLLAISITLPLAFIVIVAVIILTLKRKKERSKTLVTAFSEPKDSGTSTEKRPFVDDIAVGNVSSFLIQPSSISSAIKTRPVLAQPTKNGSSSTPAVTLPALNPNLDDQVPANIGVEGLFSSPEDEPFVLDPNLTAEDQLHAVLSYVQQVGITTRRGIDGDPPPEYVSVRASFTDGGGG